CRFSWCVEIPAIERLKLFPNLFSESFYGRGLHLVTVPPPATAHNDSLNPGVIGVTIPQRLILGRLWQRSVPSLLPRRQRIRQIRAQLVINLRAVPNIYVSDQ